jgi:hypothetical protein
MHRNQREICKYLEEAIVITPYVDFMHFSGLSHSQTHLIGNFASVIRKFLSQRARKAVLLSSSRTRADETGM